MDSLDIRVLSDAQAWRRAGHAVTLVTVVRAWRIRPQRRRRPHRQTCPAKSSTA